MDEKTFDKLTAFFDRVPAIHEGYGHGFDDSGEWWIKFSIDIEHELAWHTVQEFGHVLNYVSITQRLPTSFHPVSPEPQLNGGPCGFLSWVIECKSNKFTPDMCESWLAGKLPEPVEDLSQWVCDE